MLHIAPVTGEPISSQREYCKCFVNSMPGLALLPEAVSTTPPGRCLAGQGRVPDAPEVCFALFPRHAIAADQRQAPVPTQSPARNAQRGRTLAALELGRAHFPVHLVQQKRIGLCTLIRREFRQGILARNPGKQGVKQGIGRYMRTGQVSELAKARARAVRDELVRIDKRLAGRITIETPRTASGDGEERRLDACVLIRIN